MKMFKLWSVMAIMAVTLLTSCLGDSNTTAEYRDIPAVLRRLSNYRLVADTNMGTVYSPNLEAVALTTGVDEGDCILVSFIYDTKTEGNDYTSVSTNGYSVVTLEGMSKVSQSFASMSTDTTKLEYSSEFVLTSAIASLYSNYLAYINEEYLFITSKFSGLKDQKSKFQLYLDPYQTSTTDSSVEGNVYKAYLRAYVEEEGTSPKGDYYQINAFNVKNQLYEINRREENLGKEYYTLKIYYVSKIEGEGEEAELTWKSDLTPRFPVIKSDN